MSSFTHCLIRTTWFLFFTLILTAAVAQAQPGLLSPLNKSFVETTTPTLRWKKLGDASVYIVTIFSDRRGTRKVVRFTVKGHSCPVRDGYLAEGKQYWWHVAPRRNGVVDEPSQMWSFMISQAEVAEPEAESEPLPTVETTNSHSGTYQTVPEVDADNRSQSAEDSPEPTANPARPKYRNSRDESQETRQSVDRYAKHGREFGEIYQECGLGAVLSPNDPTIAVITNVTYDLGTTAISSNSSSPDSCHGGRGRIASLINKAYELLEADLASGNGKYLNTLTAMTVRDSQAQQQFKDALRKDFAKVVSAPGYTSKARFEKEQMLYNLVYKNS